MNNFIKLSARLALCRSQYSSFTTLLRPLSYKSDISLDKIYPNSKLSLFTPPPPPKVEDKFNGYIPIKELDITYSRASGPGGQNVNCVSTKVDLRFKVESASWLSETTKKALLEEHKARISKDGYFILKSDLTRSQQLNLADVLEKLRTVIRDVERPKTKELSPETVEKLRRRHERANRERLMEKRKQSDVKSSRQAPKVEF